MAGRPVRVQEVSRRDGRRAYTIVWPGGEVYGMPDRFLRHRAGGTDRTYAYLLVDHLRWLEFEGRRLLVVFRPRRPRRFCDLLQSTGAPAR